MDVAVSSGDLYYSFVDVVVLFSVGCSYLLALLVMAAQENASAENAAVKIHWDSVSQSYIISKLKDGTLKAVCKGRLILVLFMCSCFFSYMCSYELYCFNIYLSLC